jgi:guanyl-specific ribonuclease Sa
MKKILLSFFLLTSLNFYSQVTNMAHCAGDTTFNLTYQYSLLIGNLNPAETTVSYHLTVADASNGLNAILNPTNFIVPQNQGNVLASQTIYARINHLGDITTNYFNLIVNPYLMALGNIKPIDCYSDGTIMLDVFGGQAPFICIINGYHSFSNFVHLDNNHSILPIPNLVAGIYNIEIIDAIGCHTFGSWTIEPSSIIRLDTPTVTLTNVKCKGNNDGAITINATGGKLPYSYSIDDGATYVPNNTFTNLVAGKYFTYVKDANGCTDLRTYNITEPTTSLQVAGAVTKPIDCISNAVATLIATGGTAPYTYSKDGFTFVQSNVFDNLVAGTYTTFVKDANGCINQNFIVISPLPPLNATIVKTDVRCKGNSDGSITINATGGQAPYVYSVDNGVTYLSSNVFSNLVPGTFNITVKDSNNCTSSVTAAIGEPALLSMMPAVTKPIDCISDTVATLTATGGTAPYTYSKDGFTFVQSNVFDNLAAGTYTTFVKDANGCINQKFIVISPLAPLNATIVKNDVRCNGNNDGSITINATGGQAPYEYSIGNGFQKSNIFNGLSAGSYNVTIKDTVGCLIMISVDIVKPTPLNTTTIITKPIDCVSNAILNVTTTGGTPPYLYSIDSGTTFASTPGFSIATAGSYSVYVKDNNGCINTNNITIAPFDPLTATTTSTNINCYGNNTGSITAIVTRGQAPYSYSIGNGFQTSNIFTNLSAGLYNLTIKDALGCSFKTAPITITQPAFPLIAILETKDQTITINTSGGTGIIKYAISPDLTVFTTKNTFTNLSPGIYDIVVQDENGCFLTYTTTINAPAPLVNGKSETTIVFKIGQTLADIKLDIPNIKWYLKAIGITSKTSRTTETPLPLNTIIVDGTTYYASQTVNGIESTERLAVTVKSNGSLSTKDFDLASVNYSPNPVKHILTINNTTAIDEIEIFSVSGKSVLSKKINSIHSEIDLSSLSTGVYFLKVKSESKEKIMKIIKE